MEYFLLSCLLCLLCTLTVLQFLARRPNKTPANLLPGPARLPIIGNLHNLGDQPHKSLADLAKIHGPLMSLKLGQITTIVASSPAVAREILRKHDQALCERQLILAIQALDHHQSGLPWLPVESKWRNLRKVCNSYLFTTQKLDSNQGLRRKKIEELLEGVRRNGCETGKAVDIGREAFRATLNALSMTILSLDLANDDEGCAKEFKEIANGIMTEAGKSNLGDYYPVLGKMDLQGIQRRTSTHFRRARELFGSVVDGRLVKLKSESYVSGNDMFDTLLAFGDENSHGASMDTEQIKSLFLDLFIAGTDTTTSTLEWAMAELLRNPNALTKVQEELDQTIGKGNHLQESDIHRLPYTTKKVSYAKGSVPRV
ncbi:unnamed protein product [Linum trigynum]|uniref:Cytochrome P450 n=1 Tax=Linum trigynum TaxID=586398 RepID=A0AAV2DPS7_9ROSI